MCECLVLVSFGGLTANFLFESSVLIVQRTAGVVGMLSSKKKLLLITVLSVSLYVSLIASAKAVSILWTQTYEAPGSQWAYSLVETSDGGFALAGNSLFVKTDASGNMEWNRTYSGDCRALVATSDGGYALAGYYNYDFLLIKTNATGHIEWSKTYGNSGYSERAYSLVETSDGGYALAGSFGTFSEYSLSINEPDSFFVKTDSLGNMEWNQTYKVASTRSPGSLIETSDGGYALACHSSVIKTDALGNVEWSKTYSGYFKSLIETSNGLYALTGCMEVGEDVDFWLAKIDVEGNIQWSKTYDGGSNDEAYSLVEAPDGGYLITGHSSLNGIGAAWLVGTDSAGNKEWDQKLGGSGYYTALSVITTSDGGYALAGSKEAMSSGGNGFWLVKIGSTSLPTPTPSSSPSPSPTASPSPTTTPSPEPNTTPEVTPSPTPFPTNYTGARLTETEIIIGAAIAAAVIGGGLGLLIYLTKRK